MTPGPWLMVEYGRDKNTILSICLVNTFPGERNVLMLQEDDLL